eukprot:3402623-Rhodomonas_salina.3
MLGAWAVKDRRACSREYDNHSTRERRTNLRTFLFSKNLLMRFMKTEAMPAILNVRILLQSTTFLAQNMPAPSTTPQPES